jgi:hypothetical protein
MNDEQDAKNHESARANAKRKLGLLAAALLGSVLTVTVVLVVLAIVRRDPSPEVSRELIEGAATRWQQNGPSSYDIETVVQGRQQDVYRVSVRNGEAISLVHNGTPIKRPQGRDTWSVPGMFDTIRRDVETVERVESGQADKYTPQLHLKADFEPKYGYPIRYRRTPKSGGGEIVWNVTVFEEVEHESD